MEEDIFVRDRVLHVKYYTRDMPIEYDDLGTLYEGYISHRVGANLPMSVLRAKFRTHRFCKYDADYIIVYKDIQTLFHELLHAKFYLDSDYRKKIQKRWESLSEKEKARIQKKLFQYGYPESVHIDEWQAYGFYV